MATRRNQQRELREIIMKKGSFIPGIKDGRGETVHYKIEELTRRGCAVEIDRDGRMVTFVVAKTGHAHEFPFEQVARMVYEGAKVTSQPTGDRPVA